MGKRLTIHVSKDKRQKATHTYEKILNSVNQ